MLQLGWKAGRAEQCSEVRAAQGVLPAERALQRLGAEVGACGCTGCPAGTCWDILCTRWTGDSDVTLSQAVQNLIVLAREEPGAEKIFQSDGVRLLTQLLDTAKADLMLAALRTLVGLCSGHRSRVGPAIAQLSQLAQGKSVLGTLKRVGQGSIAGLCLWLLQPC